MTNGAVRYDFFPDSVGETVEPFALTDLEAFFESCVAFVPFVLDTGRVYALHEADVVQSSESPVAQHLRHVVRQVSRQPGFRLPKRFSWRDVRNRYARPVNRTKNVDVRMAFRRDGDFLVKKWFSFGLRTVGRGLAHVYQTANAPLLAFGPETPRASRDKHVGLRGDARDAFLLEPDSVYVFKPGRSYTLLAFQKTAFRVDVVPKRELGRIAAARGFRFRNPFHRTLADGARPAADPTRETPCLEKMARGFRSVANRSFLPEPGVRPPETTSLLCRPSTRVATDPTFLPPPALPTTETTSLLCLPSTRVASDPTFLYEPALPTTETTSLLCLPSDPTFLPPPANQTTESSSLLCLPSDTTFLPVPANPPENKDSLFSNRETRASETPPAVFRPWEDDCDGEVELAFLEPEWIGNCVRSMRWSPIAPQTAPDGDPFASPPDEGRERCLFTPVVSA